jgi:hypothetical protein
MRSLTNPLVASPPLVITPAPRPPEPAPAPTVDQVQRIERPTRNGVRTVGLVLPGTGGPRWQPVVDRERVTTVVAVCAAGATAASALAVAWAVRGRARQVGRISMGHGGWVSFKGAAGANRVHAPTRRAWWSSLWRAIPRPHAHTAAPAGRCRARR